MAKGTKKGAKGKPAKKAAPKQAKGELSEKDADRVSGGSGTGFVIKGSTFDPSGPTSV
jgi:hypothetical protein